MRRQSRGSARAEQDGLGALDGPAPNVPTSARGTLGGRERLHAGDPAKSTIERSDERRVHRAGHRDDGRVHEAERRALLAPEHVPSGVVDEDDGIGQHILANMEVRVAGTKKERRDALEVTSSEMKNHWHEYLERVSQGRQEIVVTRYGEPIAKLTPADPPERGRGFIGFLAGTITVTGDIIGPTGESWDADA